MLLRICYSQRRITLFTTDDNQLSITEYLAYLGSVLYLGKRSGGRSNREKDYIGKSVSYAIIIAYALVFA